MAQQIKIRRDTAANWTSVDPILAQGEPALETDTAKQKIGDGTTAWTSLAYIGAGTGDMVLASVQTVTGSKTFNDAKLLLRNVANTFSSWFTNVNTAARTYTLPDKNGTVAMLSDISGGGVPIMYNVKDYGALGDGIDLLDGAITASDATFTSITSAFTAGDVGKVIAVEGAGTAGAYHVTTIASYTGAGEVELTDNAVTTVSGSNFYYGTDDTTDIQTTIQAAFDAGGGVVYLPLGIYIIDGPLLNNVGADLIDYNSQLYIPAVDLETTTRTSITIEGEIVPPMVQAGGTGLYHQLTVASGTCIRSTIQGSGTYPSVFANTGAATYEFDKSWTLARFSKLNIQVTPDANDKVTMGGINCLNSSVAEMEHIVVMPFVTDFSVNSGKPDVVDVVGIALPANGGEHINSITNCLVGGLTHGFILSDHGNVHEASAICCTTGVTFQDSGQTSGGTKIVTHWCIYDIGVINTVTQSRIFIQHLQIETTSGVAWYDNVATINDPSHHLIGKIDFLALYPYTGANYDKIGGQNLQVELMLNSDGVSPQTGTTYTPIILDAWRLTTLSNASPITVTIPPYTDLNYDHDTRLDFIQEGAGQVTFVGGTGVTINTPETLKLRKQYSVCSLIKKADNTWSITGDLELV